MAFYTKHDFGSLTGFKTNNLSNYIKRGKVILTGGLIDDSIPQNASFLKKFSERAKNIIVASDTSAIKKESSTKNSASSSTIYGMELKLKRAELAKKAADTIHVQLKIDKLTGASIPTDLVKGVVSQLSKSLISSFKDGADGFLIEISKRKSLTINETAELRGVLINVINQSSTKAIAECKKNIRTIVNEFSTKREVGEHD
jgi:hypothetical protein